MFEYSSQKPSVANQRVKSKSLKISVLVLSSIQFSNKFKLFPWSEHSGDLPNVPAHCLA